MQLLEAIPALPVRDIEASISYYQSRLGFALVHRESDFAILRRDSVVLHLWAANDEAWRKRTVTSLMMSGAESFLAGTASCRVRVSGIDDLYKELAPLGVLHGNGALEKQPWGDRDFAVVDSDNNLITFFEPG